MFAVSCHLGAKKKKGKNRIKSEKMLKNKDINDIK